MWISRKEWNLALAASAENVRLQRELALSRMENDHLLGRLREVEMTVEMYRGV